MKKILSLILLVLFPATFAFAADVTLEELKSQITDLQSEITKMSRRIDKNEVHRIKDKVDIGLELRTRMENIGYKDVRALPAMASDMLGLWMRGYLINADALAVPGSTTAWDSNGNAFNDAFDPYVADSVYGAQFMNFFQNVLMTNPDFANSFVPYAVNFAGIDMATFGGMDQNSQSQVLMGAFANIFADNVVTAQEKGLMQQMFRLMEPRKYNTNNSSIFTNKLRIRLNSTVNEHLSFTGRLVMYKVWGDATDVQWMDGSFKSMYLDGNAGAVPTDDKLHVERAYFVYKNEDATIPWHISFGRRPSDYGPGKENSENAPLGGSPLSHIIQWQFDGASLQFNFENIIEALPGSFIKFCYGKGYESGWGSSNAMASNNGLISNPEIDDVEFLGVIVKFFDNDDYKFWYNYARGMGITDGYSGAAVMPFAITGQDTNLDGSYDEFQFDPNYFGAPSRLEASAKVGDMEWHSLLAQGNTFDFSWFVSAAMSKSHPDGQSRAAMYQFMDQDRMLGTTDSKTGNSIWVGVMTPELPFTGGKLGFEYNQGSKYWVGMTAAEDDLAASKLAVRGKVYEAYYHQPIIGERLFLTLGYQHFDYEYTGSGSYLGAPVKVEDATALNTMMPVTDKVDKVYLSATYRY